MRILIDGKIHAAVGGEGWGDDGLLFTPCGLMGDDDKPIIPDDAEITFPACRRSSNTTQEPPR